ncbi:hypothetical protein Pmar_PMAR000410 [Perkinsus marinus ATCC 50983]|uniref:Uncharacterized protein n=1 Tax=Perkinsus marinus (strain ATCC 50983 / TXsc) TaxID=423536 RepID=C5L4D4_PERM5|nr:hypothetical protein Pmar_PMAR000410 [Perkinsus marinus ATCC 50983]EER08371.1 hypothetical protein Pmar_PMAR000410 [Perkinsus marinus ATCC 50983]|eukprot:XP_002776555.1 hypothetical protein Pmar_PMAR000410 [Perkinsus marinus ATCC 50983]
MTSDSSTAPPFLLEIPDVGNPFDDDDPSTSQTPAKGFSHPSGPAAEVVFGLDSDARNCCCRCATSEGVSTFYCCPVCEALLCSQCLLALRADCGPEELSCLLCGDSTTARVSMNRHAALLKAAGEARVDVRTAWSGLLNFRRGTGEGDDEEETPDLVPSVIQMEEGIQHPTAHGIMLRMNLLTCHNVD